MAVRGNAELQPCREMREGRGRWEDGGGGSKRRGELGEEVGGGESRGRRGVGGRREGEVV